MSPLNSGHRLFLLCIIALYIPACIATSLGFNIIHRYSEQGQKLLKAHGDDSRLWLIFSQGNLTIDLGSRFGWIQYALVDLGTPNVTFLVALDTGSDLFWVPCECQQCSTLNPDKYPTVKAVKTTLSEYTPSSSTTSSPVSCSDSLCELGSQCSSANQQCPYKVQYLSDNTATSGVLVKDVIHLAHENNWANQVQANITFGCGQNQTGIFLDGGAFNGLMGLGLGQESLPSLLAKDGLIQNSFSMCFSNEDTTGRILFGDTGIPGQKTTAIVSSTAYFVSIEGIQVGKGYVQSNFKAIFDTGTSLTYLPSAIYSAVTTAFDQQIQLQHVFISSDSELYNFCYRLESSKFEAPVIILNFTGGADYEVFVPYILIEKDKVICLAVMESNNVAIIGQNFMGGYKIIFNRETQMLGWTESNCYDTTESSAPQKAPTRNAEVPSPNSPLNVSPPRTTATAGPASSGWIAKRTQWYIVLLLFVVVL